MLSSTLMHVSQGLGPKCSPLSRPSLSGRGQIQELWEFSIHAAVGAVVPHLWLTLACLTAQHVGPNKHTLICTLYEYSDTAVCDTEIAAGVLGPHRYPSAMPGQKPLHLGQDRPSRAHPGPESPHIPPVTPSTQRWSKTQWTPLAARSRSTMTVSVCHHNGDEIFGCMALKTSEMAINLIIFSHKHAPLDSK